MSHHKIKLERENESMEFIDILSVSDCECERAYIELVKMKRMYINRKHAI